MRPSRLPALCLLLLLFLSQVAPAAAVEIRQARLSSNAERTRIVLDLSASAVFRLQCKNGQLQLKVSADGFAKGWQAPPTRGRLYGWTSQQKQGAIYITAAIDPASRVHAFALKPSSDSGDRLVLDLLSAADDAPASATSPGDAAPPAVSSMPLPTELPSHGIAKTLSAAALLGAQRNVVVVIDAGHGGKDPGSHGSDGTLEKNITLAVARDLAAAINRQPGMQAILTRRSDVFIPLQQRYQIAREHAADLFVSIHADAYLNSDAHGSSVWMLSSRGKSSEAARWLADRENRADLVGGVTLKDKQPSLVAVLLDLQQSYALKASASVAGRVLKQLATIGPTHRGYVERANFVVLRSPDIPSILVETAFISNPGEECKLRNPSHQVRLANAIMGGIRAYFTQTPPPGTWFAARARRHSEPIAVAQTHTAR